MTHIIRQNNLYRQHYFLKLSTHFLFGYYSICRIIYKQKFYIIIFIFFSAVGQWWYYFTFWLLPLLTFFQLFLRIRNIAEHAGVKENCNDFNNARTTYANILERAFVAPYYVNYHLEHHLLMFVPCYKLKEAHKLLLKKGHKKEIEITKKIIISYHRNLLKNQAWVAEVKTNIPINEVTITNTACQKFSTPIKSNS